MTEQVTPHHWRAPYSAASDMCGAIVMRGGGGDECGLPPGHPIHNAERRLVPGLEEDPERRYTYGGRVAHLLAYGIDYGVFPYATAYCGYQPQFGAAWLGSGNQDEANEAARLPVCKRCRKVADETAEFIAGLMSDLGVDPKRPPVTGQ